MNKIVKAALTNSLATAAYVVAVATLMNYISQLKHDQQDTVFAPIAFLLLLICSAAITGFLVFGRPVLLYHDGKKKDAIQLLIYTLSFLFVLTVIAFGFVLAY